MTHDRIFGAICALFIGCALLLPYVGGYPAAYVTMALILILSVWHYATPWRVPLDPGALLLLLAFGILAIVFAIDARPGTNDALFALNFVLFAHYAPLTGALGRVARPGNALTVSWLALASALVAFAVAIAQVAVFGLERAEGFGSDPIHAASVALLFGFFSLIGFSAHSPTDRRRHLFLLGPVLGIGAVLFSGSRGPALAVPVLVVTAVLLGQLTRKAMLATGILIAVEVVAFAVLLPDRFQRFLALGDAAKEIASGAEIASDLSLSIRMKIYEAGYRAFLESPWLGHGWAMKTSVASKYAPGIFPDLHWAQLHSDIANLGVAAGVFGLLALLLVLIAPVMSVRSSPRDSQHAMRRYGVATLVLGFVIFGLTDLQFGFEFMTTFYIAIGAILAAWCRDETVGGRP